MWPGAQPPGPVGPQSRGTRALCGPGTGSCARPRSMPGPWVRFIGDCVLSTSQSDFLFPFSEMRRFSALTSVLRRSGGFPTEAHLPPARRTGSWPNCGQAAGAPTHAQRADTTTSRRPLHGDDGGRAALTDIADSSGNSPWWPASSARPTRGSTPRSNPGKSRLPQHRLQQDHPLQFLVLGTK